MARRNQPPRRNRPPRQRDVIEVTPDYWGARGEAVVRGKQKPLLVWQGIPGETARVEIRQRGNHQSYAQWVESDRPDDFRVEPQCARFHPCGSCPLMHLDPDGQRDARRELVLYALRGEGLDDVKVGQVVPSPDGDEDFRHVIKLIAGYSDRGRPQLGAPGRFTRRVVPIPECHVVHPALRELTRAAAHHMIDLDVRPFDGERGLLRYIQARRSRKTGRILVTLVARYDTRVLYRYAERIALACEDVVGVHLHINERHDNAIFERDEEGEVRTMRLMGETFLTDSLLGVDYHIGPADFFQTNPSMAEVLYQDAIDATGAQDGVPIVDLYSGVGGFALALAGVTGWAVGVESNASAVRRARQAASSQRVPAEFLRSEVADALPGLKKRLANRRPVVIVDPARRGLEADVALGVLALDPRRIVYVSCSPKSLARDLAKFTARGWTVESVQPYDMFPNTPHLELLCVLNPPDGGEAPVGRGPRRRVVVKG